MTHSRRRAFSLLEIVLALAILAGAVAALSQLNRSGLDSAQLARDSTRAQLYCESKMAEIAAGLVPAESQSSAPLEDEDETTVPDWLCTVEVNPASQSGLIEVCITVSQDPNVFARPVDYTLTRWIVDPSTTASSTGESTDTSTAGDSQ